MKIELSKPARLVEPGEFEPERHYYPRVLNASLHPILTYFFNLSSERLATRYCHMNPRVDPERLRTILGYRPSYLLWAGADLFHVTTAAGSRQMVVIETNSCPSGQKSMPQYHEMEEQGSYRSLVERTLVPLLSGRRLPSGALAVVYDKNEMEASGYAASLADHTGEPVYLVTLFDGDPDPAVRFSDGVMEVRTDGGEWHPVRAAIRYVTQRPWNRIPIHTKTAILNPVVGCLAGGRNKMLAAKAYDLFNADLDGTGLQIRMPETIWNVNHHEIPLWVKRLGGFAVVKVPYSNAGQGVYTITSRRELDAFMEIEQRYDQFIVQSLIGNYQWSSGSRRGRLYHVGTVPNKHQKIFVADLRMMIAACKDGFRPLVIYGRRARSPLIDKLEADVSSWEMLGTNLSIRTEDGGWEADTRRLMMMDRKDFNALGIGIDELVEAFIQTVLAVIAIDRLAGELFSQRGRFRMKLFRSLNNDPALIEEILP